MTCVSCCQCGNAIEDDTALCHECCVALDDYEAHTVECGPTAAMTDEECRVFEQEVVPFGKFAGLSLGGVPLGYLDWLDGLPNFRNQLNRYLRNKQVAEMPREAAEGSET